VSVEHFALAATSPTASYVNERARRSSRPSPRVVRDVPPRRPVVAQIASLDEPAAVSSFARGPVNLRWILVHMIDETARHAGHLDVSMPPPPTARNHSTSDAQ
jgi:hypothetical protein